MSDMYREFVNNFPIYLIIILGTCLTLCVISVAVVAYVKKQDAGKELFVRKAKVLEKLLQQGSVAWYLIEFENGERAKLRTFQANDILLFAGDVGTIKYRGVTIEEFQRD